MSQLKQVVSSSVFQKVIMGLSGIGLVGFIIFHLIGNLPLYLPNGDTYNAGVASLYSLGSLLLVLEIGLLVLFLIHIVTAIKLKMVNSKARPDGYEAAMRSKKGPSKASPASKHMIISGLIILVFLVLHIWHFRFGPSIADGYVTQISGHDARDLHRLVVETFRNPLQVGFYVVVLLLLGSHIRHGFWSAFQSLGWMQSKWSGPIYALALVLALVLAVGFLFIPLWIYFDIPGGYQ